MIRTRLLSVAFKPGGYGSVEANRDKMVEHVEQAGSYKPDFIAFPEVARELGLPRDHEERRGHSRTNDGGRGSGRPERGFARGAGNEGEGG